MDWLLLDYGEEHSEDIRECVMVLHLQTHVEESYSCQCLRINKTDIKY